MADSFVFYKSFADGAKELPDKDRLELYDAIIAYGITGEELDGLGVIASAMLQIIKPQIEANRRRYEAGLKGGRPKREDNKKPMVSEIGENKKPMVFENAKNQKPMVSNDNENKKPMVSENEKPLKPMVSENAETEKPNVYVNDNDNVNDNVSAHALKARVRKYDPDTVDPGEINRLFVEFWELYPKKTNEDAACRAWVSMVDSVELAQEIIQAVKENNRRNTSWKRSGGRYVPNAENWLFDRRWRDEIREEKDDSPKEKDPFQVEGSGFEFMDDKWLEDFKERKRIEKEKLLKEKKEAALHGADTNAANMG